MATLEDTLANLTDAQKAVYQVLIDASVENLVAKQVQFNVLKTYIQKRHNRITNLVINIKNKRGKLNLIASEFHTISSDLNGKSTELDELNGRIKYTFDGDVKKDRLLLRDRHEYRFNRALLDNIVIDLLETSTEDLKALSEKIAQS